MESLASSFSKHSLADSQKLLYIDGYNNLHKFYNMESDQPPNHWDLVSPFQNIKRFVEAATKSCWILKLFIKSENIDEEEKDDWMCRREKEVEDGRKYPPPKCGNLLYYFFTKCGVEVLFSNEADSDDTLAAYAQKDKAAILSRDRDFFRFEGRNYVVFQDFSIDKNGFLEIFEHKNPTKKFGAGFKKIMEPVPKTLSKNIIISQWKKEEKKELFFGCPSSLVRQFGNPYLIIRPLRQAVYHRLGLNEKKEYIVEWDKIQKRAIWDVALVKSNEKYEYLLDKPTEAVEHFFQVSNLKKPEGIVERTWYNHIYSLYSVTCELCSLVSEESEKKFFELIEKIPNENYSSLETSIKNLNMMPYNSNCVDCGKSFSLNHGEMFFFKKRKMPFPKRCKECLVKKSKKKGRKIIRKKSESDEEEYRNEDSDNSF